MAEETHPTIPTCLKVERPKPPPLLLPFLFGRRELRTKGVALGREEEERVWSKFFRGG
jgi:hypothetical protein